MTEDMHPGSEQRNFILFGEDDIDDEEILREIFAAVDKSFDLQFINKGKKLVEVLDSLPDDGLPCLLILDYNMPELNGSEMLELLSANPRYANLPKVIWSTSGSDTYKNRCLELGANDYIIKPSKVNDLMEAARYMLSFCK